AHGFCPRRGGVSGQRLAGGRPGGWRIGGVAGARPPLPVVGEHFVEPIGVDRRHLRNIVYGVPTAGWGTEMRHAGDGRTPGHHGFPKPASGTLAALMSSGHDTPAISSVRAPPSAAMAL